MDKQDKANKKGNPFNIEIPTEISPKVLALSGVFKRCHFTEEEIKSDPRLAKALGYRLDDQDESPE